MAIQILLADNSDLTIRGARAVIEEDHRMSVVAVARSTDDLLVRLNSAVTDTVILNDRLYDTDIFDSVERVRAVSPRTHIIVMGLLSNGLLIRDLLAVGVSGYLFKSDNLENHLVTAVDTVMRDRLYLSPTANAEYLVAMQSPRQDIHLDRESCNVLHLLANGFHIGEIASQLNTSVRRVYWVRQKLRNRFGATTNEHMISLAAQEGFLSSSD